MNTDKGVRTKGAREVIGKFKQYRTEAYLRVDKALRLHALSNIRNNKPIDASEFYRLYRTLVN